MTKGNLTILPQQFHAHTRKTGIAKIGHGKLNLAGTRRKYNGLQCIFTPNAGDDHVERKTMHTPLPQTLATAILEQCADAVIYSDREGIIRFWNAAAERLFGFAAAEALGQSLDLIIPERLRTPHWQGYHAAMASGRTRHAGKPTLTKGTHRSGENIYVEMSFAVVADQAQGTLGSVAIARQPREPR